MKDIKSKKVTKRILSKNKNKQVLYVLRSKIRPKKIKSVRKSCLKKISAYDKNIKTMNKRRKIDYKIRTKKVRFKSVD
tara:strand:- start:807 stop:1040 length:234 start_codon:yes stop_codon:yes gene_type:complete